MTMRTRILTICAFVAALAVTSCGGKKTSEEGRDGKLQYTPQVNEVEVITLERTDFARQLLSNGKLAASRKSALLFGTSGKIASINVKNGSVVGAGATIATLDRPDLRLALESADIALKKAEIDLYDFLAGQGYSARDTASVSKDLMATARMRSGYTTAENGLSKARYDISGTVLRAPFHGRVADVKLRRYDQYSVTEPFCTIIDDRTLDVDFTVMESEYSFLSIGLPVKIRPFAAEGKEYAGKITGINPSVDSKGQILVRAQVANDGSLIDGMNVKVVVERMIPGQLVVPRSAVVIRDNLDVLFTYTPDGRAHWTYVKILYSNGDSHVVTANTDRNATLNEGDQVIVSGNLNLADNSEVTLKD